MTLERIDVIDTRASVEAGTGWVLEGEMMDGWWEEGMMNGWVVGRGDDGCVVRRGVMNR